jgi:hypothetical protein
MIITEYLAHNVRLKNDKSSINMTCEDQRAFLVWMRTNRPQLWKELVRV